MPDGLPSGSVLAGFRVERQIGAGGMGAVYLAVEETLDRAVALKVVAPELAHDARYRERFLVEARLAARLEHPAIVPVYQAGEADGELYLAMRYMAGGSLADHLAARERLSPADVLALLAPIADALDAAHATGLIHRDVKPANILVQGERAYLADFGLARPAAARETFPGQQGPLLSGTIGYLAPEQLEGDPVSGRTDQYALACVLYECFAGRTPYERTNDLATVYAHLTEAAPVLTSSRSDLPRAVDGVITRGLAKRPGDRYASCRELVDALADACGLRAPAATVGPTRRRRALVAAVALAGAGAVAIGTVVAVHLTSGGGTVRRPPVANPVVVVDATSARVVDQVAAGGAPSAVAYGAGAVWVLDAANRTITKLDPRTHQPLAPAFGVGATPVNLVVGDGALWVSTGSSTLSGSLAAAIPRADAVQRVDLQSRTSVGPSIRLPPPENGNLVSLGGGMAITPGALWVVDSDGSVARIDTAAGRVSKVFPDLSASAVAAADDAVWVLGDGVVERIDPRRNAVTATVSVNMPEGARAFAVGAGSVWIASSGDGVIWRVDPGPPVRRTPIRARPQISALAYVGGSLWGVSDRNAIAVRVDPRTDDVKTVAVGGTPTGIVAAGGGLWIPSPGAGVVAGVAAASSDIDSTSCGPVIAGGTRPRFLIASEEPLAEPLRPSGVAAAAAIQTVLEERHYRAGRYTVGMQSCNDATPDGNVDPTACAANAKAYARTPRVVGVIGTYYPACAIAMMPFLASADGGPIPFVSPFVSWDGFTLAGYRNFVRVTATDDAEQAAVVPLAQRLGVRRLFIVSDEGGANVLDALLSVPAGRAGIALVGRADWATPNLARNVARSHADGVIYAVYGAVTSQIGGVIDRLRRQLGPRVPMIAIEAFPIASLRAAAGPAANGMYVLSQTPPEEVLSTRGQQWLRRFAAAHGTGTGTSLGPQVAQATEVLLGAISHSDGSRASILRAVRATRVQDGILGGDFRFTATGDMSPAFVTVLRVQDGAPKRAESDFTGAVVTGQIDAPSFTGGFTTQQNGAPVSITATFGGDATRVSQNCHTRAKAAGCTSAGTFQASGPAARLLCPDGAMVDANWFPNNGPATRERTYTCGDGSTLRMLIRFEDYADTPAPSTARIDLTWVITGGTGRMAHLRGEGVDEEVFRFPSLRWTVVGRLTGDIRTG